MARLQDFDGILKQLRMFLIQLAARGNKRYSAPEQDSKLIEECGLIKKRKRAGRFEKKLQLRIVVFCPTRDFTKNLERFYMEASGYFPDFSLIAKEKIKSVFLSFIKLPFCAQKFRNLLDLLQCLRHVFTGDRPDDIQIDSEIMMREQVAESRHVGPVNV